MKWIFWWIDLSNQNLVVRGEKIPILPFIDVAIFFLCYFLLKSHFLSSLCTFCNLGEKSLFAMLFIFPIFLNLLSSEWAFWAFGDVKDCILYCERKKIKITAILSSQMAKRRYFECSREPQKYYWGGKAGKGVVTCRETNSKCNLWLNHVNDKKPVIEDIKSQFFCLGISYAKTNA